ncbi:MAG: hypothetical protein GYB26_12735 [Gammaproteobacteria bacterium]|nr:hypothetical protein [Gammaproteobacteria bacterium]
MDTFNGRVYAFLPCCFTSKDDALRYESKSESITSKEDIDLFFENEFNARVSEEISSRGRANFTRKFIENLSFNFDGEHENDLNCNKKSARIYSTVNSLTHLCVLNIVFFLDNDPVTQFLDRLSRENITIDKEGNSNHSFYDYLKSEWGLTVVGKARACLSTGSPLDQAIKPSIFASEMYESSLMDSASLLESFDSGRWNEDLALYSTSSIHASKTVIVRYDYGLEDVDQKIVNTNPLCDHVKSSLRRDLMLIFIVEILMFREASIKRANMRVSESINTDRVLNLSEIDELMNDFKSVILFWDLDIFLYPTAQQLADVLNERLDIDRVLETYQKNQSYLEQRVNIATAIDSEKEAKVINYIAIIVFFFESINILFVVSSAFIRNEPISWSLIYSGGIAFAGSVLIFLVISLIVRLRSLRRRARSWF